MRTVPVFAAALLLTACAAVPPGPGPEAPAAVIDEARLAEHVRVLASDEFEGRGPGTAGETKTVAYISEQFRLAGLEPGGPNGSWTQDVPLVQSDITGAPSLSFNVGGARQALTQGEQVAIRASLQNVDRVSIRNAPLVFVGYGVKAPERNWDDYKGVDLRGKIAVVLVNDPDFETGQGDFGGKAMTYYGRWTYKYEEGARQGAAGVLVVHETAPASYGWATVKNSNTNTMFDVVRSNPAESHPLMEGWVQRDVTADLFRRAGLDFEQLKRQAQTREFRPVTLPNTTFSAEYGVKQERIASKNVIGRLPGRVRPNETVLYTAHWDHLGVGAPDATGDRIYNGAVDNATGIAALIEIGRAFAQGPRPERSVVMLAVSVEEKGLLGSEYYAGNPVYPLATTAAGFNIDALTPLGPARDLLVVGSGQSELEDRLLRVLTSRGRVIRPDPSPEAGYFFRSDHFPLAKRGVPMLYIDSGQDLLVGGVEAARAAEDAYRRDRYHQPADEYDPATWNFGGIAADAAVLHQLGLEIASSRAWPNYRETSEFRPERDKTAALRR
ncbi:MAG: M28 family metallopeptidase [Pseudomonadota bacterium]|nr:M28 family metallopeptidase [Pseudomonadota bacterium]